MRITSGLGRGHSIAHGSIVHSRRCHRYVDLISRRRRSRRPIRIRRAPDKGLRHPTKLIQWSHQIFRHRAEWISGRHMNWRDHAELRVRVLAGHHVSRRSWWTDPSSCWRRVHARIHWLRRIRIRWYGNRGPRCKIGWLSELGVPMGAEFGKTNLPRAED